MKTGAETHQLRQEIERALRSAFDPADVLPRLARLARLASPASEDGVFAHRQLAELLVERHPWRAALYARRVLAHRRDDDRAWAVLAFCQTLLGNFRAAAAAYRRAIASAPSNPWYAHNLGHLMDVALGIPERALPWLRSAYGAKGDNSEIVASYAHALARAGHLAEARDILMRARARFESRELEALVRWLDQGAPSRSRASPPGGAAPEDRGREGRSSREARDGRADGRESRATATAPGQGTPQVRPDRRLTRVLERGMAHLPLDPLQRERALALARDALANEKGTREGQARPAAASDATSASADAGEPPEGRVPPSTAKGGATSLEGRRKSRRRADELAGLAAAVAYAIVYVDHVPLSQAEVAAPFRVAVAQLRGRFAELRARLDLIRGDARYATTPR